MEPLQPEQPAAVGQNPVIEAGDLIKPWVLLPIMALNGWVSEGFKNLFAQPGHAIWVTLPLALITILAVSARTRVSLRLKWKLIGVLAIYVTVFFAVVGSGLLDWPVPLVGYEKVGPRNFLKFDHWDDWHYLFADAQRNSDLAVILKKPTESIESGRLQLADIIELASESEAKGVALDYYFSQQAEDIDKYLCEVIKDVNSPPKKLTVLVGYDFEANSKKINRLPNAPTLSACLGETNQGHAIGYQEFDQTIRSTPLYRENNDRYPALSLRIANELVAPNNLKLPDNHLVQFVKPENELKPLDWDQLWEHYKRDPEAWSHDKDELRDKFILVGDDFQSDQFQTPYGLTAGAMIHAFAAHSLRHSHIIVKSKWWASLSMILASCFLMLVVSTHSTKWPITVGFVLLLTLLFAVAASLAMYLWLNWIDLIYSLIAIWLFLPVVLLAKKIWPTVDRQPLPTLAIVNGSAKPEISSGHE